MCAPLGRYAAWSAAGQIALIVLALVWAVLERGAPIVHVRWRASLSPQERTLAEQRLLLEAPQALQDSSERLGGGGSWRYELGRPTAAHVAAIVEHPDVEDTHHIDRQTKRLAPTPPFSRTRVWLAGPLVGSRGAMQFRIGFGLLAVLTLFSAWRARRCSILAGK